MYQLLIVEDEKIIRNGLTRSIPWESWGFRLCGECENGQEALEYLIDHEADVILTDIRMPEMDGLTLAKEVRQIRPHIKLVVLSGYSDFLYAQKALEYKVSNYILKPVEIDRLYEVFIKLKSELDEEQMYHLQMDKIKKINEENFLIARNHFLFELLKGSLQSGNDFKEKAVEYGVLPGGQYYACSVLEADNAGLLNKEEYESLKSHIKVILPENLKEYLKTGGSGIEAEGIPDESGRYIFIFSLQNDSLEELNSFMREYVNKLKAYIREDAYLSQKTFSVGVGCVYKELSDLKQSLHEALHVLENRMYHGKGAIVCFKNMTNLRELRKEEIQQLKSIEKQIINDISIGGNSLNIHIDEYFNIFMTSREISPLYLKKSCIQLLAAISEYIEENNIHVSMDFPQEEQMEQITDVLTLKDSMKAWVGAVNSQVKRIQQQEGRNVIQAIKEYLLESYMKDISLSDISEKFEINPSYLSWMFKKETGQTYLSYLSEIRINKAKELLKSDIHRIYEVSSEVGYNDYRVFCKVFKKAVGLSPGEYKRTAK